ncbi:MAG: hypothetical protein JWO27_1254, partial [Frankiales bacterium]|nr:hypothetical protein [Frankiales bacterium]
LFISVDADIVSTIGNLTGIKLPVTLPKGPTGKPILPPVPLPLPSTPIPKVPKGVLDLTGRIAAGQQSSLELLLFGGFA